MRRALDINPITTESRLSLPIKQQKRKRTQREERVSHASTRGIHNCNLVLRKHQNSSAAGGKAVISKYGGKEMNLGRFLSIFLQQNRKGYLPNREAQTRYKTISDQHRETQDTQTLVLTMITNLLTQMQKLWSRFFFPKCPQSLDTNI